jgi:hypothetical protein
MFVETVYSSANQSALSGCMELSAGSAVLTANRDGFIRRFLLHVLPHGLQRIRHYGFLANRYRAVKLACCRRLLGEPAPAVTSPDASLDYRERYEQLTGKSLRTCPKCGHGRMICIETFLPGALPRAPPRDRR